MEEMRWSPKRLLHGGDYNPEQWLDEPEVLARDIERMKQAKINEVSLGIFSWAVLEPEEGVYRMEWMEEVIERLYANGISVILATPSGARPKWMSDKYPEVLRVNARRERQLFGGRHNHCFTSPIYREKVRTIDMELARRFGSHPAVIAWHISNEFSGDCHCPLCQKAFQDWLKKRYGSIDALNHAWATTFWSHTYPDFSTVESPSPIGEGTLHALKLDWNRFVTDQTRDFVLHEKQAIRDGGSNLPVTINMMTDFRGLNYHKFADAIEFASWDSYPEWYRKPVKDTARETGYYHDQIRSIRREPFLLMESCPSGTNWQSVTKLKKPGMLKQASLQAIAHGSDSVLYFQIRQSRGSSEKFHGAVLEHYDGTDSRVFQEVCGVGEALESLNCVCGAGVNARAAILLDGESRWAMEDAAGPRNAGLWNNEAVYKSYHALRRLGFDVDVVDMEQTIDRYQIVVAPMLYMFRAGIEEKIRRFVADGGVFILTYWSGIVDETDLCFMQGTPHGLMDVMGLRSTEIDGLYDGEKNSAAPVEGAPIVMEGTYTCERLCELVALNGAKSVMNYTDDFYGGTPAVTENTYGNGKAYHICADFEQAFYNEFYEKVARANGIELPFGVVEDGLEVTTRENETEQFVFLQNFTGGELAVPFSLDGYEVIYGSCAGAVAPMETVVLRREKNEGK